MPEMSTAKPRRATKHPAPKAATPDSQPEVINITAIDRNALIAQAAYLRAQGRDFAPGHELEDWLAAEREVDAQLITRAGSGTTSA